MSTLPNLPTLNRQESETSQWTNDAEKEAVMHLDQSRVPQTITEEDEGPNVGLAAYERSKEMGEIVRRFSIAIPCDNTDSNRLPSRTRESEAGLTCSSYPCSS